MSDEEISLDQNELLIEEVRKYEDLYNMSSKNYCNNIYKEKIWRKIGEKLNKTGTECKSRWVSLRDQWRRALNKKKPKSGQARTPVTLWKYEGIMSFLLPFVKERETQSNIPLSESRTNETPENTDNSQLNEVLEEDVSVNSTINESAKPTKRPKLLNTGETQASQPTSSVIIPTVRKYRRETRTEPESASAALMKYLIANKEKPQTPCDPIDAFFTSLAGTVKTFSPYYQNIAKTNLLNVVSKLELAQMQQLPNFSGSQPFSHESIQQPTPMPSPSEPIYADLSPPSSYQSLPSGTAPLQNYIPNFSPNDQQ